MDNKQNFKIINPPALPDLLDEQKRDTQLAINCVQIGIIQEFDATKQIATIKIALKQVKTLALDGTKTFIEYPLLIECPVMVLFGGVDFMSMPIVPGDNCIVLFNDRAMDNWYTSGGVQEPSSSRIHDLSDAIAIVGIRPLTNSIATYLTNGIRLSHGGGNAKMDLTDNLIDTIATLFMHHGNMQVTGNLLVEGNITIQGTTYGNGGNDWNIDSNINQTSGRSIHAGNGANGTFNVVTVVDGIVISGS